MKITGKWYSYYDMSEFEFEGRRAIVVYPKEADQGRNWTLKTEYWDAFPGVELEMLARGFHAAYLENKTRFATPEDSDAKARFVDFLSSELGLKDACVPVGMSCGGAHAVNVAAAYPNKVCCLYIDAPVLNFCDFPARYNDDECAKVWENEFIKAYPGVKRSELLNFSHHPINKVGTLIENKIPVLLVYGTEDKTVLPEFNAQLLIDAYSGTEGLLTVIKVDLRGHHPHGMLSNNGVIADYIVEHSR